MGFPDLGARRSCLWTAVAELCIWVLLLNLTTECLSVTPQPYRAVWRHLSPPSLSPQCTACAHHVVFHQTPTVDSRSYLAVLFSQVYVVRRDAAHLLVGRDVLPRNQDTICLWCYVHLGPSWWCYKTQDWLLKLNDLSWLKNLWKGITAIYLFLSSIPWLMPLVQLCPDKVQIHWCHSTHYLLCVLN